MNTQIKIKDYIASLGEPKGNEIKDLHNRILHAFPHCKLWYNNGIDDKGKIVANPNIGYGSYTIQYANGTNKEFYQVGLSANKTGISVYILGFKDKDFLRKTFGANLGKASITGYCIKFKTLKDIQVDILMQAINYRLADIDILT